MKFRLLPGFWAQHDVDLTAGKEIAADYTLRPAATLPEAIRTMHECLGAFLGAGWGIVDLKLRPHGWKEPTLVTLPLLRQGKTDDYPRAAVDLEAECGETKKMLEATADYISRLTIVRERRPAVEQLSEKSIRILFAAVPGPVLVQVAQACAERMASFAPA